MLRLIIITIFSALCTTVAYGEEWGEWDDLPDDIFSLEDESISIEEAIETLANLSENDDLEAAETYLKQWLLDLNDRLDLNEDELEDILEDLANGDELDDLELDALSDLDDLEDLESIEDLETIEELEDTIEDELDLDEDEFEEPEDDDFEIDDD